MSDRHARMLFVAMFFALWLLAAWPFAWFVPYLDALIGIRR